MTSQHYSGMPDDLYQRHVSLARLFLGLSSRRRGVWRSGKRGAVSTSPCSLLFIIHASGDGGLCLARGVG